MANEQKDLERSDYDPKKDLQKKKEVRNSPEPPHKGNPLNS